MNLTTVGAFKNYIDVQDGSRDQLYGRILVAASDYVERYCGRSFAKATYNNELYDGNGRDLLLLKNWPIITMTSIKENGASLTFGDDMTSGAEILVYKEEGKLARPFNIFFNYRRWYSVTYDAGFATIPAVIVQATLEIMLLMIRKEKHIDLSSKGAGRDTATYENDLTGSTKKGLDLYRDLTMSRAA